MIRLSMQSEHIQLFGKNGMWQIVESQEIAGKKYFILESELYGKDAMHLVVDEAAKVIAETEHGFTEEIVQMLNQRRPENILMAYAKNFDKINMEARLDNEKKVTQKNSGDGKQRISIIQRLNEKKELIRKREKEKRK